MSDTNTLQLAEKIADLLRNESRSDEFASLQKGIEKINRRLDLIESQISPQNPKSEIRNPKSSHPSLEKYDVVEAVVERLTAGSVTEKTCAFEPNERPCDACSMCSSRGF
jgi:hypothetical protein